MYMYLFQYFLTDKVWRKRETSTDEKEISERVDGEYVICDTIRNNCMFHIDTMYFNFKLPHVCSSWAEFYCKFIYLSFKRQKLKKKERFASGEKNCITSWWSVFDTYILCMIKKKNDICVMYIKFWPYIWC